AVRLADDETETFSGEHAPFWQDAIISVSAVEKGESPGPEVTVRFAESSDMKWRSAPKFAPGQEGRFVLRRPTPARRRGAQATPQALRPYTALDRNDFQPANELLS